MKKNIFTYKGFTLVELLIVISIIGILAAIILASFTAVQQRARDGQRKADLRQIQSALELYKADHGVYPSKLATCVSDDGTKSFMGNETDSPSCATVYLQTLPLDPRSKASYTYIATKAGTDPTESGRSLGDCDTANACVRYALIACVESTGGMDDTTYSGCTKASGGTDMSYTLQNP